MLNGATNGMNEFISTTKNMYKVSPLINNIKYNIINENDTIQKTLLQGVQWNKWAYKTIKSLQKKHNLKNFLNVGSHVGCVSLPLANYFETVTCIEPFPPTYNLLTSNINLNNLSNVIAHNYALGASNEEEIFFLNIADKRLTNNSGGMHCLTQDDIHNNRKSASLISKEYKSKMYRLDAADIGHFDIMLIDVEGTEYELFEGGIEKIKKFKPIIITEIWNDEKRKQENLPTTKQDVFDLLYNLGYTYESFGKERKTDFCFLPNGA